METNRNADSSYVDTAIYVVLNMFIWGAVALYTTPLQFSSQCTYEAFVFFFIFGCLSTVAGTYIMITGMDQELRTDSFLYHAKCIGWIIACIGLVIYVAGIRTLASVIPLL